MRETLSNKLLKIKGFFNKSVKALIAMLLEFRECVLLGKTKHSLTGNYFNIRLGCFLFNMSKY